MLIEQGMLVEIIITCERLDRFGRFFLCLLQSGQGLYDTKLLENPPQTSKITIVFLYIIFFDKKRNFHFLHTNQSGVKYGQFIIKLGKY